MDSVLTKNKLTLPNLLFKQVNLLHFLDYISASCINLISDKYQQVINLCTELKIKASTDIKLIAPGL